MPLDNARIMLAEDILKDTSNANPKMQTFLKAFFKNVTYADLKKLVYRPWRENNGIVSSRD